MGERSGVKKEQPLVAASYAILLAGAAAMVVLFFSGTDIWNLMQPRSRVLLFLLWLVAPLGLCALNILVLNRFLFKEGMGRAFVGGSAAIAGSGLLLYGRAFFLHHGDSGSMDQNMVFLFTPLVHFVAAVAVTGYWIIVGVRLFLRGKEESS